MITLFNTTDSILQIDIKDKSNKHYAMFIEARKTTKLLPWQITNDVTSKINKGILAVVGGNEFKCEEPSLVVGTITVEVQDAVVEDNEELSLSVDEETLDITDEIEDNEEVEDETLDVEIENDDQVIENNEEVEDNVSESSEFVCSICGNEFASKRGLDMHMSRSHNE